MRLGRACPCQVSVTPFEPQRTGIVDRVGIRGQRALGLAHFGQRRVARAGCGQLALGVELAGFPRFGQGRHARRVAVGAAQELGAHLGFARVFRQFGFARGELGQERSVRHLRDRIVGVLHRQPHGRNQKRDQQDDVLRHLGPGDGAHPAQERAHQDAGQAQENPDRKIDAGKARRDQADRIDLRHHIRERDEDGRAHGQRPHRAAAPARAAAVARRQEVGHRVLRKLAQVGRDQQRDQHEAAGPAHDEGQAVEALQIQAAGQADEAGRRDPVGRRRHAVEHGRHAPAGDVVFGDVRGAADHADDRVQRDRGEHEQVADPQARHAFLLEQGEGRQEHREGAGVRQVVA